jgi:hypothetical protein
MAYERERGRTDSVDSASPREAPPADGRAFAFETLVQEVIRRTATLGLSGFFATEEALRKAFSDAVPADWLNYLNRQGDDARQEMVDALAREFGSWLKQVDVPALVGRFLEHNEITATITLSSTPRDPASASDEPSLRLAARKK